MLVAALAQLRLAASVALGVPFAPWALVQGRRRPGQVPVEDAGEGVASAGDRPPAPAGQAWSTVGA